MNIKKIIYCLLFLVKIFGLNEAKAIASLNPSSFQSNENATVYFDTTITNWDGQKLNFKLIVDIGAFDNYKPNAQIIIVRVTDNKTIFIDSIVAQYPGIEFKIVNADQYLDFITFRYEDKNKTAFYDLFVYEKPKKTFLKISGFEHLENPRIDRARIIRTCPSKGPEECSYYYVNAIMELKKLFNN